MSDKPEDPLAFPATDSEGHVGYYINDTRKAQVGMTLRDYFAGQALVGLIADQSGKLVLVDQCKTEAEYFTKVATLCGLYADAMLKARQLDD